MAMTMKNAVFWDVTRVALIRTDVLAESIAYIIRATRSSELGETLAVTSNFLRNVGSYKSHTASHPRIRLSSYQPP
jgi:hypothetical protein